MKRSIFVSSLFVAFVVGSAGPRAALAGAIAAEASWRYSDPTCWGGSIPAASNDLDLFIAGMTAAPNYGSYYVSTRYQELNYYDVWSSDFVDPQRTLLSSDSDNIFFDSANTSISYYAGHGACQWVGDTNVSCTHDSQCNSTFSRSAGLPDGTTFTANSFASPPFTAGATRGFCRAAPGDAFGVCAYPMWGSRNLVLGDCKHPANRNGLVPYTSLESAWGESPNSGAWGNAGTNGGTNVVVLHASCASMTGRQNELWNAFAGIHFLATTLVHSGGDVAMSTIRGQLWAQEYQSHPTNSASYAWLIAGTNNPSGSPCRNSSGTVTYGSGMGINGCGGHEIDALAATAAEANLHFNETWYDIQNDVNDGKGNSWYVTRSRCNWDCSAWPINRP